MTRDRGKKTPGRKLDSPAVLRSIIDGTSQIGGELFFRTLVSKLAESLQVAYAFVTEFNPERTRAHVLASWEIDQPGNLADFDLAGTPCATVVTGIKRLYPRDIQTLFPEDIMLADIHAEGYLATPLIDAEGTVMGHLAVIDTRPIEWREEDISIFDFFALRATAELDRLRAHTERRRSEQWLNSVLASVMDAVVVLDAGRRVLVFNAAAERVFNTSLDAIQNQPMDRLLSAPLLAAMEHFIQNIHTGKAAVKQMYLPEGIKARRNEQEEFTVEATLSALPANNNDHFILILRDVEERRRANRMIDELQEKTVYLREAMDADHDPQNIIAGSSVMEDLMTRVRQVANTSSTVLLLGETGTGKELIAHGIHRLSSRRDNILVKVNCAALPTELIESELFGHEKGAFTGATGQRKGRFELADGGTLFLDEIGELSPSSQSKLLRVLQDHEFERVGGTQTLRVNVRLIAATNRDLGDMVGAGKFRADLFYRLNVFPLTIPPLRERLPELPQLVKNILVRLERKIGKRLTGIAPDSLRSMYRYTWPGNVRELQNLIERAAILSTSPILDIEPLLPAGPAPSSEAGSTPATLQDVERKHIELALELVNWVVEGEHGAAALLGLNPSTLRYRMQKLGLQRPQRGPAHNTLADKTAGDFEVLHNSS